MHNFWKQIASAPPSQQPVFSKTTEDFAGKLASGTWKSVIAINKRTQGEPAYANALRNYATERPEKVVQLFIWDDHGDQIDANTAVLGTTSINIWQRGNTTTAYTLARNSPSDEAVKAHTNPGLSSPNFNDVLIAPLTVVGSSTQNSTGEGPQVVLAAAPTPCEVSASTTLQNHMVACWNSMMGRYDACNELYGPPSDNPTGPPQDAAQWGSCLASAAQDYGNCINSAIREYQLKLAVCQRRNGPITSQPADPPPG